MSESLLKDLVAGIEKALPEAAELRRAIHADPQLSGEEEPTRDLFMAATPWLDWSSVAHTGAWTRTGPAGAAVGLRAEMDALPVLEATTVEWRSQRHGIMHACGHDIHLAALWALLTAARDLELPHAMLPVLQPREEATTPGATDVVASGLLGEQEVEAMLGVHVQPQVTPGVVSTGAGAVNAAFDAFEIVVRGQSGHGAYPHLAVDPITTLTAIIDALSSLPSRIINPIHPCVVSFGEISAGTAPNVIPGEARARGSIRSFHDADRLQLQQAIVLAAESIAASRGAVATARIMDGGPALVNDPSLVHRVDPQLMRAGITVAETPFRSCGSDDFAEYGPETASLMCFVGTGRISGAGLHQGAYLPGRETLRLAARTYAAGFVGACALIDAQAS